jgi:hypothetical protein
MIHFSTTNEKAKRIIAVGDKFRRGSKTLEVIGTKPGGKIELFDRENCMFTDRPHREVKTWERVS